MQEFLSHYDKDTFQDNWCGDQGCYWCSLVTQWCKEVINCKMKDIDWYFIYYILLGSKKTEDSLNHQK